jgi:predicted DNA-binding protein
MVFDFGLWALDLGLYFVGTRFARLVKKAGARTVSVQNSFGGIQIKGGFPVMDVFELLKQDHEKVSGIFEKLDKTTERGVKTREELFAQLKTELDIHSQIEEQIFYPAIKEAKETHDITLEAIEEHAVVKRLLKELDALSKDDEKWGAKLTVLKENVEHHVEEEEDEMFKDARKVLSEEQIETLGARMQAAKEQKKAQAAG